MDHYAKFEEIVLSELNVHDSDQLTLPFIMPAIMINAIPSLSLSSGILVALRNYKEICKF